MAAVSTSDAKIPMARPNESDMLSNSTKTEVRLGIYSSRNRAK